jgi:rRNA maturation endonuclease Nob1
MKIHKVEQYDVSAIAFACLGAGLDVHFHGGNGHWLEAHLLTDDEGYARDLVKRAIGVANSTPMLEIKTMAECCGLGARLDPEEDVCPLCGSHRLPKATGEPAWRVPT